MPAYLAILDGDGINTGGNTYELHDDLRPQLDSNNNLVEKSDSNGNLLGESKFEIVGTCTSSPYGGWINVESYAFNVRHANLASASEFTAFVQPSATTPQLVHACATNRSFKFVRLEVHLGQTGGDKRLAVTMRTVKIINFRNFTGTVSDGQSDIGTTGNVDSFQFEECEWGHVEGASVSKPAFRWSVG